MNTNFENLCKNPLDNVMVSYSRRTEYTDIHIERMTNSNQNGDFDQLIADTQVKRDAFTGNLDQARLSESLRIGYTLELNNSKSDFITTLGQFEGFVKSVFGKKSPEYLMFFPFGIEEYRKANQANTLSLMGKVYTLAKTYKTQLNNPVYENKFKDYIDRYKNAFSRQKQSAGSVTNSKTDKEILWNDLKNQLYINMLSIILLNKDNPQKMLDYFEPKLLRYRHHTSDDTPDDTYKLSIAPNTSATADISFSPDDTLLIINDSNVAIFYYGAATADQQPKTAPVEIAAGDEAEVTALSLGAPANRFLIIQNKDASETAEVEIALI